MSSNSNSLYQVGSADFDEEEFQRDANIKNVLAEWRRFGGNENTAKKKKAIITHDNVIFHTLRKYDVLFGRGPACSMRPGNTLVRKAIEMNREYYNCLPKFEKRDAAKAMVDFFESRGLRFLLQIKTPKKKRAGHSYCLAPPERVLGKIQQSLREIYKHVEVRGKGRRHSDWTMEEDATQSDESSVVKDNMIENQACEQVLARNIVPRRSPTRFAAMEQHKKARAAIKRQLVASIEVGDRLGIYWPLDKTYYPGIVVTIKGSQVKIHYDDGDQEMVDLLCHDFFLWKLTPNDDIQRVKSPKRSRIAKQIDPIVSQMTDDMTGENKIIKALRTRKDDGIPEINTTCRKMAATLGTSPPLTENNMSQRSHTKGSPKAVLSSELQRSNAHSQFNKTSNNSTSDDEKSAPALSTNWLTTVPPAEENAAQPFDSMEMLIV